jgi:transposase
MLGRTIGAEEQGIIAMPAPYSEDFRQKAIAAVERGERKIDVSCMFNISRNTLDQWLQRQEQTGRCEAMTNYQCGNRHKITDWQRFREFVQEHGDKTQAQMAKLWGEGVTQQNISDAMQKIGVSRKKRRTGIENAMNSSIKRFRNA